MTSSVGFYSLVIHLFFYITCIYNIIYKSICFCLNDLSECFESMWHEGPVVEYNLPTQWGIATSSRGSNVQLHLYDGKIHKYIWHGRILSSRKSELHRRLVGHKSRGVWWTPLLAATRRNYRTWCLRSLTSLLYCLSLVLSLFFLNKSFGWCCLSFL